MIGEANLKRDDTSKNMKYLEINLSEYVLALYAVNYKIMLGEMKRDLNKWWDMPSSCIERFNVVNMLIFPQVIFLFNAIQIKNAMDIFW